ncbi:MAG: hypothetical protein EZS28_054502 [Streblomastix strix]|uniref:Secreted protein n=1 Tax=Streblomastix strix TaxID=222440 RepID=A0A5J4QLS9_9EUKA|nr:MAG: hypothetical protein EZS28_054502 [Streblomastix strix]
MVQFLQIAILILMVMLLQIQCVNQPDIIGDSKLKEYINKVAGIQSEILDLAELKPQVSKTIWEAAIKYACDSKICR